jgi:hypothetical protein
VPKRLTCGVNAVSLTQKGAELLAQGVQRALALDALFSLHGARKAEAGRRRRDVRRCSRDSEVLKQLRVNSDTNLVHDKYSVPLPLWREGSPRSKPFAGFRKTFLPRASGLRSSRGRCPPRRRH